MKIFFTLVLVMFLAFSGYHLTFRRLRLPLFAQGFYLTGTEFLFFGLLLGPQFLNVVDPETATHAIEPMGTILLSAVGLIFGLQFEIRALRRFPVEYLTGTIVESLVTFILVFTGSLLVFSRFPDIAGLIPLPASLVLAATAACTAPTGLALMTQNIATRNRETMRLLQYISGMDGVIALIFFGTAFLVRPTFMNELSPVQGFFGGIATSLGTAVTLSLLFTLYFSMYQDESEIILVVLGMVIFTGGIAAMTSFSPLVFGFFTGICLINFSREKTRLSNLLGRVEKPAYLLILIFLGLNWHLDIPDLFLWGAVFCLMRAAGKLAGGYIITRTSPVLRRYPPELGLGLLGTGGLPLAILLDFQKAFPYETTPRIISLILIAVIYNEMASPPLLNRLFRNKNIPAEIS